MNATERYLKRRKLEKIRETERKKEIQIEKNIISQSVKRGLGYYLVRRNIIVGRIAYHHINDIDVIAIPLDLHQLYGNPDKNKHRFMCNQIAKQLYKNLEI